MFFQAVNAARVRPAAGGLLLDQYPGATFAIGLRKLRNAYTGACMRVRRASDNTEQDIGFNATGGLDTTALATFCAGTTGFIRTWYDQSVSGNNAGQTATVSQPQIFSSGQLEPNGALFGNDNLVLQTASTLGISGSQARTMFAVVKRTRSIDAGEFIFITRGSTFTTGNTWFQSTQWRVGIQGGNVVWASTPTNLLQLTTLTLSGTNVTNHTLRVNGASQTVTSSLSLTVNTITTVAYIGHDPSYQPYTWLQGNISELILYNSDQTSNHAAIEGNIDGYYNIY